MIGLVEVVPPALVLVELGCDMTGFMQDLVEYQNAMAGAFWGMYFFDDEDPPAP